jgi:alpha-methylacyl-CoA racemase
MAQERVTGGPLAGVKVLEFAGIGPGPFCCMLLADMGAEVVRIGRAGQGGRDPVLGRGRHEVGLDLKDPAVIADCLKAIETADVLIEGFRPGVMERLGLGPDIVLARNPRLIYGRMTGWGQEGPLAQAAGHDINYIAITGALSPIGPVGEVSQPPLNLVGDFGGGSLYLAYGIVAALFERERSGKGQVIDAAIVDGAASLMAMFCGLRLSREKGQRMLGGDAPYYRCYSCADGKEISVGALEPQFYDDLVRLTGAAETSQAHRLTPDNWPELNTAFEAIFKTKTQAEWCAILEGTDACFGPVLDLAEAPMHPHMKARGVFEVHGGVSQPAPAPRLSRTPGAIQASEEDGASVLARWRGEAS